MKILALAALAIAGLIHWFRCQPNRDRQGRYMRNTTVEKYGVYVALAVAAVLILVGCKPAGKVEHYPDALGTVERTTYPDGSVRVRYVP